MSVLGDWKGKRVLVTGHTGFKGGWLYLWLERLGADVTGLALPPATDPSLFALLSPAFRGRSVFGDIRDAQLVRDVVTDANPEYVFHLAAQPIVRESYDQPLATFATNVMGTAHLLDACRSLDALRAVLVVTSDKVYEPASAHSFDENDRLGGHDPYSASKAAAEITAASWRRSFFSDRKIGTARAGNVIGGGDWANDRLVPDIVRSAIAGKPLHIRFPNATRPWQHVLEPLYGYLLYAQRLGLESGGAPWALNFGPAGGASASVRDILGMVEKRWPRLTWNHDAVPNAHENPALAIRADLATSTLGWRPALSLEQTIDWTLDWYSAQASQTTDAVALCLQQIASYEQLVTA